MQTFPPLTNCQLIVNMSLYLQVLQYIFMKIKEMLLQSECDHLAVHFAPYLAQRAVPSPVSLHRHGGRILPFPHKVKGVLVKMSSLENYHFSLCSYFVVCGRYFGIVYRP